MYMVGQFESSIYAGVLKTCLGCISQGIVPLQLKALVLLYLCVIIYSSIIEYLLILYLHSYTVKFKALYNCSM